MAYMASASDTSVSNHFDKIAATGYMRSSPTHSSVTSPTDSMASFCNSFANSPSYQSTGSPSIHQGWCGSADLRLLAAENPLQSKTTSHGTGSMEHGSLSNRGVGAARQHPSCSTSAEVLGATVKNGERPHVVDMKTCLYGGSMASLPSNSTGTSAHAPQSSGNGGHHLRDAAMIREFVDRMSGNKTPGVPSLDASIPQKPGHPMEKLLNRGSSWSSDALVHTVDPCKGGLATSHCLTQFTSDPALAERAANFSSFNGGADHSQTPAQPLPVLIDCPKPRSRSGRGQQAHVINAKLSGTSSTIGVKVAGEAVSSFQTCLDSTMLNTMEHDSQVTQVCTISDGEKEPCANGSSLPSLEAIEGAKESSGGDGAAALEDSDPGIGLIRGANDALEKKRKSLTPEVKDHESWCRESTVVRNENTRHKRCKVGDSGHRKIAKDEVQKPKAEGSCNDNSDNDSTQGRLKEMNPRKLPLNVDISKQNYIHVRARRGQATDSHSLAERVRREKISERMKYLQDLVPGCSKVTGKAVMLDEIINYVQSLQHQVEHLSMKLASMPPQMDVVNFDPVITKEMLPQSCGAAGTTDHASLFNHHAKLEPLGLLGGTIGAGAVDFRRSLSCNLEMGSDCDTTPLHRCLSSVEAVAFQDSEIQGSTVWDGDLQSMFQMGILQCGPASMMSQCFNCTTQAPKAFQPTCIAGSSPSSAVDF